MFFTFRSVLKKCPCRCSSSPSSCRRRSRVRTSVGISLAWTSWKRPAPGLTRRVPKTAQMAPVYGFCVIVFDPSCPGLVLSLRDVEFLSGSRRLEVPLNSFALKFSVSRGRCGIIASMRFVSSFLLLKSVGPWVSGCSFGLFCCDVFGVQRSVWEFLI